jgi:hypothetical protein
MLRRQHSRDGPSALLNLMGDLKNPSNITA